MAGKIRVAVIGAGPAGFYTVGSFLQNYTGDIETDMFDRLTPYGLVRYGVAPDHLKIKAVTKIFDRIADDHRFHFFGNVEFGKHIFLEDLQRYYHIIVFATGAQTDRALKIPGIHLHNSHSATEFVAWYNGHPDYRGRTFDLSCERAVIIGIGDVALDIARILCLDQESLKKSDIAPYALDALLASKVKEVYILGRRGPAQAAFANPMLQELLSMGNVKVVALPNETVLDEVSEKELRKNRDKEIEKKVSLLASISKTFSAEDATKKKIHIRFLVSPTEIIGENESVRALRLVKNAIVKNSKDGSLQAEPTGKIEELECGLLFRSVGYQGVALPDIPFSNGKIPNEKGRIISDDKKFITGLYVAGWIKRGAIGVIGTNKICGKETALAALEDIRDDHIGNPQFPDRVAAEKMIRERQPRYFSFEEWKKIDELERQEGEKQCRPRVKFTSIEAMLDAIKK